MSEKRFIRNIVGNIYDSEKDKWFEEDWKGKPLDYDDDLIVFLNEQQATINLLLELLYISEEIIIGEFSSTIEEDLDKLDKLFKKKDIKEIEKYVRGNLRMKK